jgi:hypothetical protein
MMGAIVLPTINNSPSLLITSGLISNNSLSALKTDLVQGINLRDLAISCKRKHSAGLLFRLQTSMQIALHIWLENSSDAVGI